MNKPLKFFLISFIISSPLWWGINVLGQKSQSFFFWHEMATNPQILAAQVGQDQLVQQLRQAKPFRNPDIEDLELSAKSVLSIRVLEPGVNPKVLFEKNSEVELPIASLTKLMTALVVLENYDLAQEISISQEAVAQDENIGEFMVGERFRVKDLVYSALLESSNDAAYALGQAREIDNFVDLMNQKAQELGLERTRFINPTGLDPEDITDPQNYSTSRDLANLFIHLSNSQPLIQQILGLSEFTVSQANGAFHHTAKSTNKLLEEALNIIGGKTGYTDEAGGCFILALPSPDSRGYIINVILGSSAKFSEMRHLIDWLNKAYLWKK